MQLEKIDLKKLENYNGKKVKLGIRPEHIDCDESLMKKYPTATFELQIDHTEFLGKEYYVECLLKEGTVRARISSRYNVNVDQIKIVFNMEKAHFFDAETTNRIVEE